MKNFIEFKTIPKPLIEEGITIDLLHQVQMHGKLSPVQLMTEEKPVNTILTQNGTFFFIMLHDGSYLKNKEVFIKETRKEIIIARARYLLNHLEEEINSQIDNEVERIKKDIDKKVDKLQNKFKEMCEYADWDLTNINHEDALYWQKLIISNQTPDYIPPQVDSAKLFFETNDREKYTSYISNLNNAKETGDYDNLYHQFYNKGIPLIASFNYDNINEMSVLKKLFHKDKLPQIIDEIKKDSLRVIARVNIEKKYAVLNN